MLTVFDVPKRLDEIYRQQKSIALSLFQGIESSARRERIPPCTNILPYAGSDTVLYIMDGFFRFFVDGRGIRLYSNQDFLFPYHRMTGELRLESEFTTTIALIDLETFVRYISKDRERLQTWLEISIMERSLMSGLAAALATADMTPRFIVRPFAPGADILREGDPSDHIFELVEGQALLLRGNVTVGRIAAPDIFGEVGFFTRTVRVTTVRAQTPCIVRILDRNDLKTHLQQNPTLFERLLRRLGERLLRKEEEEEGPLL